MFEDRSLKIDLVALAMFALVAFLGIALWTYDATDPPSTIVWPATNVVHNACGRAGRSFRIICLKASASAPTTSPVRSPC